MGGIFSKPKAPDTSAQVAQQERALKLQEESMARQEALLKEQQDRLKEEEKDATKQLVSRRRSMSRGGRSALLSPDRPAPETGLSTTLGTGTGM